MSEGTLAAHLEVVFQHLASQTMKKAVPLLGCANAATKVRRMLLRIQAVIRDAEERQGREVDVRDWLGDLKCVICDADDVLDELSSRFLQLDKESSVLEVLADFDYPARVSRIGEKLDEIVKVAAVLKFNELVGVNRAARVVNERRGNGGAAFGVRDDEEESVGDKWSTFGREVDRENVVKMLLGDNIRSDFDVVSLVGQGGIGKTTLARIVFNDDRVVNHFRLRIWVSVSVDFDARRLTKAIIESATGNKYLLLGIEAMQRNLRTVLSGKRFLLVLDNLHKENFDDWGNLKLPLMSGARGSKLLVTTSSDMVPAKITCLLPPYHLKGLSSEDCWLLFKMHAFDDKNAGIDPDLEIIGKEIVKRCRNLPLLVKALGSLMHTWKDEYEWRRILKNQIWNFPIKNKVHFPVLWLSYLHLPMHLKQCFLYCSMLPKDVTFTKDRLIRLWMAQGFILPKGNIVMEDLGRDYFDQLFWKSFFQYSHYDYEEGSPKYILHEAIHDFARFISASEYFLLQSGDDSCGFSKSTLHLSLNSSRLGNLSLDSFADSRSLRTFSLLGECKLHEWKVPTDLFLKLNCLRVMDLSNTPLLVLPDSVGQLIHLRYLGLVGTQIECLPESLCKLFNLQTLDLGDCFRLQELPKGIKNLTNLRHLNLQLHQCKVSGMSSFPLGFGQLTGLRTLSAFVVGSNKDGCKIGELKGLMDLQGKLCISKLDNVVNEDDAMDANMKEKKHIYQLELQWNLESKIVEGVHEKVLSNLQPHANLKELTIRGFGGVTLSNWIGDPSFFNLVTLNLSDCPNCHIPPLGQLPSLKFLYLEKMGVKHIRGDFSGNGSKDSKFASFPSLKTLKFENLPELEEWSGMEDGDMPCLQEVVIVGCSKLRALPSMLTSLKKLEMWNCFCLNSLPKVPMLSSLVLRCPTNSLLTGLHKQDSLVHLEIKNCPELTSLPRNLKNLSSLKDLVVHDCKQLLLLEGIKGLLSLEHLEINGCTQLHSFPDGLPAALQSLSIFSCPSLAKWCQQNIGNQNPRFTMSQNFSICIDGQKV